jgi:phosphoglycolate phosphatase-like HAD superfamily hydrolase
VTALASNGDLDAQRAGSSGQPLAGATVLFDWNGTLVDDRRRAWAAARATLAVCAAGGAAPTDEALMDAWRLPVASFFVALGVAPQRAAAAERLWNVEMATQTPVLRDGAIELLTELRHLGATVGVVSAGQPSMVLRDVVATHVAGLLDVVVAGVGHKRHVLDALARRGRLTFVGDSEGDVTAAIAAGAMPIAVAGGYRPAAALESAGAAAVLHRLHDLLVHLGVDRVADGTRKDSSPH